MTTLAEFKELLDPEIKANISKEALPALIAVAEGMAEALENCIDCLPKENCAGMNDFRNYTL